MDGRTTPSILRKRARPDAGTWYRAGACMSHVHNVRIFKYAYMIVYNKFSDSVSKSDIFNLGCGGDGERLSCIPYNLG